MTRGVQLAMRVCWAVLVAIATAQAWMFRHEISPDGVAYLDLSDAIVNGRARDLVNGYWSPAYPFAIGAVRFLLWPTPLKSPEWEFALIHVVNLLAFVLALAAFEWLLRALDDRGATWGQQPFQTVTGRVAAYALFGVGALGMISVKGTVPDMLLAFAAFAAFACLLRLHDNPADRLGALRLGLVVAVGALTKSIFFPLGVVILATIAWPLLRRGGRDGRVSLAIAAGTFMAVTLPWVVALSLAIGKPTTGETGALNYAWYVNGKQPPNSGVMPALAAPRGSLPLDGLAVLTDARGTNPLWYDPARWHRDVRPTISLTQQRPKLWLSLQYYAYVLSPFLLAIVVIGVSSRRSDVRTTLERGYVVLVPALACIAAYSLVYTTSRYIAPVLVPACLVLVAGFPRQAAMRAGPFVIAMILTITVMDVIAPLTSRMFLSWVLALVVLVFLLVRRRRVEEPRLATEVRRVFVIGALVAALVPPVAMGFAALGGVGPEHPEWDTARRLIGNGLRPGSKIAVMGNPENAGWARLARYQIVGVIPADRVAAFKALTPEQRAPIIAAFQRAGALDLIEIAVVDVP